MKQYSIATIINGRPLIYTWDSIDQIKEDKKFLLSELKRIKDRIMKETKKGVNYKTLIESRINYLMDYYQQMNLSEDMLARNVLALHEMYCLQEWKNKEYK